MGPKIYLLYLGIMLNLVWLLACSDNITEPKAQHQSSLDQARSYNCQVVSSNPSVVPSDCYAWGRTEYPGDNQSPDYHALQAWWQAVSIDPEAKADSSGLIEIDFAMLIEVNSTTGQETIIGFLDYDSDYPKYLSLNEGGSFSRWYEDNSFDHLSNAVIENGVLQIRPGIFPKRVSHWWLNASGKYPRRSDCSYHLKCRIRIRGPVAIQMAGDYYKELGSNWPDNKEAFHSNWYGDTEGAFKIICYPPR